MSISSEINRIANAKDKISDKMESLGVSESGAKIDELADDIDSIENNGNVEVTLLSEYDSSQQ